MFIDDNIWRFLNTCMTTMHILTIYSQWWHNRHSLFFLLLLFSPFLSLSVCHSLYVHIHVSLYIYFIYISIHHLFEKAYASFYSHVERKSNWEGGERVEATFYWPPQLKFIWSFAFHCSNRFRQNKVKHETNRWYAISIINEADECGIMRCMWQGMRSWCNFIDQLWCGWTEWNRYKNFCLQAFYWQIFVLSILHSPYEQITTTIKYSVRSNGLHTSLFFFKSCIYNGMHRTKL